MQKYSLKDIAKLSEVSTATVSRVINDNGRFSEETRQKVLKVIEETGYKMNYNAKSLRMNRSFTIGILVPDISNYFFADVVQKVEEILFDKGYSTIICNTGRIQEKESAYLKMLEGKGVDGLIVISGVETFDFDSSPSDKYIPYICIDREPKTRKNTIFISSNHYQGAFEAVEKLIESGCKHPIITLQTRKSTSAKERFTGFKDALKKNSIPFSANKNLLTIDLDEKNFPKLIDDFLLKNPETDGIFCINDSIALELMLVLRQLKKNVPRDIKIIGFDDTPAAKYAVPPLSSIHQDTSKIAKVAVDKLLNLINHPNETDEILIIPVSLISRQSTN
ncbi:LacI family DNA-binding transcriptional regulator (plasmid) [Lactobacillus curvatus]|nr:LacI family DNA-binding transcriptional regulator [Latilactobacillus curvatus]MSD84814.1 LacI family DNA-binding transcriptional regulator [Latilactobacillus curvatus]MSE22864.1 LacI family DNA-binding transcriptional regulator [Latilactobacillus curvatus]MSE24958.1 LacI family DNA-binding transcriptional regulator [Latilactobacillus curvatus]